MNNDKEDTLSNLLVPGDGLLIVSPVAPTDIPSFAAHLLQAGCRRRKITVNVFYANLHFASLIGFKLYNTVSFLNATNFIGERLFTAAAFGLPSMGRNIHRLIDTGWIPDHLWQSRNETATRKTSENLTPLRRWALRVDWQGVEKQTAQWIVSTAKQIARMGYQVVGCTNTLGGLVPGIALLKHVKLADPTIITVLGGFLCEGEMAEGILSLKTGIDYIFSGESDETFPVFIRDILAGNRPKEKIIYSKAPVKVDDISLPDYREYFRQTEHLSVKPTSGDGFPIAYETSRGCRWGKCTFCGLNAASKLYRIKSTGKIMRDLGQLVKRYPGSMIQMVDNLMPLQYVNTLFPRISKSFPSIRILYEVHANLTLDQVIALKQAGVTKVLAGIESLSPSLLKRMRKCVSVRQNIAFLRYARSVGIEVLWQPLYGIPGDQTREYEEMLELMHICHHLQPPFRVVPIELTRFSPYQKTPEEFGISNLRPAGLYEDVLPAGADLEKIALFFAGDFEAQSYEDPEILVRLREEYQAWFNAWERGETKPSDVLLPTLHLERNRKNKSSDEFVLHDTRGLPGLPEKIVVDKEKAGILLKARPWDDSPSLQWAVDAKLAVMRESWFVPLAVAEPDLLKEFERGEGDKDV